VYGWGFIVTRFTRLQKFALTAAQNLSMLVTSLGLVEREARRHLLGVGVPLAFPIAQASTATSYYDRK
jgi:hypothetical protein